MTTRHNIKIRRGDTFTREFEINDADGNPVSYAGHTIKMQIRKSVETAVVHTISTALGTATISGASNNIITLTAAAATTQLWEVRKYVYDIEVTSPGGVVQTMLYGEIEVEADVTRA